MTESIPYVIITNLGEVEIRKYPEMILAAVNGGTEEEQFSVLFKYISGKNRPGTHIPMTAPVITGAKIPMTTPVISGRNTMSFVMPGSYTDGSLPEPLDSRVTLQKVAERKVAVIRFSGVAHANAVQEKTDRLVTVLLQEKITMVSSPFLMRYNNPWTPGFLRRNEVGIDVL